MEPDEAKIIERVLAENGVDAERALLVIRGHFPPSAITALSVTPLEERYSSPQLGGNRRGRGIHDFWRPLRTSVFRACSSARSPAPRDVRPKRAAEGSRPLRASRRS